MPRLRHSMMLYSGDVTKRNFLKNSNAIWHILDIFRVCKKLLKLIFFCVIRNRIPQNLTFGNFVLLFYPRFSKSLGQSPDSKVEERSHIPPHPPPLAILIDLRKEILVKSIC